MELTEADTIVKLMFHHYNHGMDEVLAKRLFRQVAEALNIMHSKRCVHLDIRPENVLLIKDEDKQLVAKLGDFEDVIHYHINEIVICTDGEVGTKTYQAPEVRKANDEQPYDPMATDIYSLGIVLFLLLTYDFDAVFNEKLSFPRNFLLRIPKKLSPEAQHLLKNMLNSHPLRRLKTNQILKHPFLR
jgi:serine/threonine-protein kinase GIN4